VQWSSPNFCRQGALICRSRVHGWRFKYSCTYLVEHRAPVEAIGGQAMKKLQDVERQIIRDWKALPKIERQTINQAWCFADEIERRYPFRGEARPYRVILGSIADYQSRIGKPLKVR
jgi:hypothetical protein